MLNRAGRGLLVASSSVLAACLLACLSAPSASGASAVSVFPIPGSRVASPQSQIAFRGVSATRLRRVVVTGSRSGRHAGLVEADSDGAGGSFLPVKPFKPGEVVTVRSSLNVLRVRHGTFRFTVARPSESIPFRRRGSAGRTRGDVWRFHSAPTLQPAAIKVIKRERSAAQGDIFVGPQVGPLRDGPEIIDPNGHLVWFQPAPANDSATDVRVQSYEGRPVLTWWQGNVNEGCGRGEDLIYDTSYRKVGAVQAANGMSADLHEFHITRSNTAWITAYYPVYWDARAVNRPRRQIVLDSVVQEIDIKTGLVLFQWDSLDHVPLADSRAALPAHRTRNAFDYFHVNSIDLDDDGNLVISARNTWAAYKVDERTGMIIWTLGGRHSSFKMGPGASFAFQHDVRVRSRHDWFVTIFDDGGGPPLVHGQSRGLELFLDLKHKTAKKVIVRDHSPRLSSFFEGNIQQLPGRGEFIGWGSAPYFTEYDRRGKVVFDARFVGINNTYRAYRFRWTGSPRQHPSLAASTSGHRTAVYASWNGATRVASWRVLGGSSAASLRPVGSAHRLGFETRVRVKAQAYVAVQALDGKGHLLAQSATVRPK